MIRRLRNLAWDGRFLLRRALDAVAWPFERLGWRFERTVVWPLGERAAGSRISAGGAALGGVALLAAGALAIGLSSGSGGDGGSPTVATAPAPAPRTTPAKPAAEPEEQVLEGAAPDFTSAGAAPAGTGKRAKLGGADAIAADPEGAAGTAAAGTSSAKVKNPGPAAIEVAERFADAFVLYETGRSDAKVRAGLSGTASPALAKALLRRPPRLPADVKVPKAKVLNVVPGPRHGGTFTLSASLLRVGVTSELRIDVRRAEKSGRWQVTDVLG